MEVVNLVSDSEDEVRVQSPDRTRPAREADPCRDPGSVCTRIGTHDTGSSVEQPRMAMSLHQPSETAKKDKEKVHDRESARASGAPSLPGESCGSPSCNLGTGLGTWSTKVSKHVDGRNEGTKCCCGDQIGISVSGEESNRNGCHASHELLHGGSVVPAHNGKSILGAKPADGPSDTPSHPWDAGNKAKEIAVNGQSSIPAHDCLELEDSSMQYSRIEGLHFPLPDANQLNTRQIELDEMFAYKLQEQLNQEQTGSGTSQEADRAIAWTLQEEDAARARIAAREGQSSSNQRDRSIAHLYSYGRHSPVQSFSSWTTNRTLNQISNRRRVRRNFNSLEVEQHNIIISQLTRGCFGEENMDIETRMTILDSLQEALDNRGDTFASHSDDDTYENLLALDDNNHHKGVPENVIASLPLSVVEGKSCCDEPCPICLDCPGDGAFLRHLPCMHKFHKECIDRWLGMKVSCPVCKSNVI